MNKDNLQKTEILYLIKSFLSKDFPKYMSKNFSFKVMRSIKGQQKNTYFENFTKLAVAASFAIVTLLLIKVVSVDNNYPQNSVSKTQISAPTYKASNPELNKNCDEENQKYSKECCVDKNNKECRH